MNYNQIAILFLQGFLVAFVILFSFRLRRKLGIGVLFACLGLFQFVQVFLSSTVYVLITDNFLVSPGSSVLFPATLFALLVIYIKEDASETKKIIYALFFVNIVMSILLSTFSWHFNEMTNHDFLKVSTSLFDVSAWVLFVGTLALILDSLLIIIIFEFISKKVRFLFLQICITMLTVVIFDTVFFSFLAFWNFEKLYTILISGLISKGVFTLFYSILFYVYLKYFDFKDQELIYLKIKDVFKPLSYKQKFESAVYEIKKAEEERKLELIKSNNEKEERIVELELSKQKLQITLELLKKSESSKNEASKVSKIGYHEYYIETNTFTWSDYVYHIFGFDPKDGMPAFEEVLSLFDKDSLEKITKTIEDIDSNGISCDVESKLINKRNEEIWVRYVAQPVYNEQNEIIGRRGVMQNITDSKLAQLELELSKQKIQTSLELLEKRKFSMDEASKTAKIAYHEYYTASDTFTWSDYLYHINGLDVDKPIPPRKEIFALFDDESQQKMKNAQNKLESEGTPCDIELRFINLKKEEIWLRYVAQPVYNEQNEIIGRRGVMQNITDSKLAQLELELSKQKIQASLDLLEKSEYSKNEGSKIAKIGYWEHDLVTDTVVWSEYLYQIFEVNPKDGVPTKNEILKRLDKESREKLAQATLNITSKGINYDIELKFVNIKKEVVWLRNVAQPIYNKQNEIVGKRGVMQNITDSKNTQLELELSKKEIQSSLELLAKSKYSMDEASTVAKIGYFEYYISTKIFKWSDYLFYIHGFDPKKPVPSKKEFIQRLDKESLEVLNEATLNLNTKGISYDIEMKIFNKIENKNIWVRSVAQPIYNEKNEIIGRRGVTQDITASKNAQHQLELSKKEIQATLEVVKENEYSLKEAGRMARIGYWAYDNETDIMIWSEAIHKIYGTDPKKAVPNLSAVINSFSKESSKKLIEATEMLASKGVPYDIELQVSNLKNEKLWIRNIGQPIYNDKNEIIGRRGVTQDITESKTAQLALELSRKEIQTTLELLEIRKYSMDEASKVAKIGYHEYDIATDTFIWSEYLYYIFGLDPEEDILLRKEILTFFDDESRKKMKKATLDLDSKGIPYDLELKIINGRNEEVWVRNVTQPVYNQQNEIIARRGVTLDITASKKAQFALELSKQKIEAALELVKENEYSLKEAGRLAKIGYWSYDKQTDIIFWSKAVHEIYGNNPKDGIPELDIILSCFDNESSKKLVDATVALASKGVPFEIELEMTNLRNEKRWILNMGEPIFNDKKEVVGRRGVSQDITQRKLKQKTLDKQHEKLSVLNNALNEAQRLSHVGSWEWNMTTDKAEWSDEMYNIYGVTKDHFYPSNENVTKTILPEDIHKIEQGINSLLVDKLFIPFEFRIRRPSGEIRHLYIAALKQNSKEGVFGVTKDITEQKIIEESNLIIRKRYQKLFNNAAVSIWNEDLSLVFDKIDELKKQGVLNITKHLEQQPEVLFSFLEKLIINKVNKATLKLFKAKNNKDFLDNIHQTFGTGADKVFGKLIEAVWNNKKSFTSEVNYRTLKGDEFAAILSVPIPQTKIERKTVPISIQSIQSVKEAEFAKKESINRLNEAQKLAKIGSWLFTPSTQEIIWSDETFNIWGFDSNKAAPKFMPLLNLVHKNDRKLFISSYTNVTIKGTSYDIEFRICLPNHKEKWIRSICKPIFDDIGKVMSLKGVNQDITAQKKAKEKIKKADEMYRVLTDNSNDLICLQEPDSTFKYISPSIKTLLGYEPSDFLGKKIFSLVHKEDVKQLKENIKKRVHSRDYHNAISFRVQHKNGHFVWLEFLSSPVYKGKEISYFVTTSRDITLWVKAKEEIQEYQTSLQKMTTEITMIEEKQKKEIASNIHDHLSQSLVISKMRINELKKNPQLKVIDEDLKFIETHISEALENSRKITYELSPPVLYQLGIIDALNWLLDDVEATHKVACQFNSNVNDIKLSDVKSIILYRSIQEVIKNAIKYANASLITLNFDKDDHGIYILIYDDGIGFDTTVLKNLHNHSGSGFGLFTVQERIKNIQGKFTIESKINVGTSVKIFIPLAT
jgi:PAS domain S-box-containing protein